MERRKALAVAAAGALLSASAVVAGTAGVLGGGDRGHETATAPATSLVTAEPTEETTTSLDPVTVTETRDVFDTVVVQTPPTAAPPPAAPPGPVAPVEAAAPQAVAAASDPVEAPAPTPAEAPTTTRPTTTTTTTVSPMPAGCIDPQLEDNGQWNCQQAESDD